MVSTTLYANPEEIYQAIRATKQDDNVQVKRIIGTVSRWIDAFMNRKDYGFVALETATANVYTGNAKSYLYLPDFIDTPTVKMKTSIDETTYDYTFLSGEILPFRGDPRNPNYNSLPYHGIIVAYNATYPYFTSGRPASVSRKWNRLYPDNSDNEVSLPTVQVTAKWGYSETVPEIIKEVCIIETLRLYKQEQAGMGDAGFNTQLGNTQYVKALHPSAKDMLLKSNLKKPKIIGTRQ